MISRDGRLWQKVMPIQAWKGRSRVMLLRGDVCTGSPWKNTVDAGQMRTERISCMRVFLASVIAAIVIAVAGALVLNRIQEPVSVAFSAQSVRL